MVEHPKLTPDEAAKMMMDKLLELEPGVRERYFAGTTLEDLEAKYREHVEEYGPAEVEVRGETFVVWVESEAGDEPGPGA